MQTRNFCLAVVFFFLGILACQHSRTENTALSDVALLHESVSLITGIIVEDIFSPPVASRIYVYSFLAAYEVLVLQDSSHESFTGKLNDLNELPIPVKNEDHNFNLAANLALLYTGRELIFSKDSVDLRIQSVIKHYSTNGVNEQVLQNSIKLAKTISDAVLKYAAGDNYKQTRSYRKYEASGNMAAWKPTPPAYIDGIEPHWGKIRPLLLDSSSQFKPQAPTPFDTSSQSKFRQEAFEVYETVNSASSESRLIADYWDCNPYKVNISGHVMHATKKITPGGHWINITGIACQESQFNLSQSLYAYTLIAAGIFDGFISCWDEKYRSNLLRPETYINLFIDKNWKPLLQTPPFPEYTSGHSVISTIAADLLTDIFGEAFSFTDNTELIFGLPIRKFKSFKEAAEEAAISRLYAGIHYRPAIENGKLQGHLIAHFMLEKFQH